MRIDRGLLNWGVFLIVLGGVPLAVQQGWAESSIAGDLWRLWPLILVGIGLGLVLRWTPLAWLGGALVAATFGLIFGAVAASSGIGFSLICDESRTGGQTTSASGTASGPDFRVDLEMSCGDLTLARGVGSSWSIEAVHPVGDPPETQSSSTSLIVRQPSGLRGMLALDQIGRDRWSISLPGAVSLALGMTLNLADGDVSLGSGPVGSIGATLNFSTIDMHLGSVQAGEQSQAGLTLNFSTAAIALPAQSSIAGATLNFSSMQICVPREAGLRIRHQGTFSSDNLPEAGLVKVGEVWETADYASVSTPVEIQVTSSFSSITLERPEVCP